MSDARIGELLRLLERERGARRAAERSAEASAQQLKVASHALERLSGSLDAIVEERTQDLTRVLDGAVRTSREQASSLAMMSHEVRTPMHTILGLAEHLLEAGLPKPSHEVVQRVLDNATRLASLIDDYLDLSRIGSGRASVETAAFDVCEVLESTVTVVAAHAARKHLELVCDIDPAIPSRVVGDARKISQILLNLVSNAVKYTSAGEVRVVARCSSATRTLDISVFDTGAGIAEVDLERVFEPFVRVGNPSTENGSGLGLALVRSLTTQLGGTVRIVSEVGRGTALHVRLPVEVVEEQESARATRLAGLRVLLVGYAESTRAALRRQLVHAGALVSESASWAHARECYAPTIADLVVIDPSAHDLAQLTTDRLTAPWNGMPLIWIAPPTKAHAATLRSLGASAAVEKPVRRVRLLAAIERIASASARESTAPSPMRRGPRLPKLRALLVEDDSDNRQLMRRILTDLGYSTDAVADGRAGLERATSSVYDVIVTDVAMPHMNGIEMVFRLRAEEARQGLRRTPVLVITASAFEATRLECERAGADSFLAKPAPSATVEAALASIVDARPTLLVVDDSSDARSIVRLFVEADGTHRVVEAASGGRAVEIVATERVDVMLVDLEMPGMNGIATLTAARQVILSGSTPILAVTGHDDPAVHRQCIALGFADVLVKPFSREQLRRVLALHQPRPAPVERPAMQAARTIPAPARSHDLSSVVVVDADIADLVPRFLRNRRRDVTRMNDALAASDFAAVAQLAHAAKGTGGGFGFHEVTRLGGDLERAALSSDLSRVRTTLAELETHLETVEYREAR